MNKRSLKNNHHAFLLLDEISKSKDLTQRDLSDRLGVALGLINSYLKTLISKGYITVSGIPRGRCAYYLTPTGFAEKARLAYQHLQNLTSLYKVARTDFSALFERLESSNVKRVVFCGVDEITEIACISLWETNIELAAIADLSSAPKKVLGHNVVGISELSGMDFDVAIITSFLSGEEIREALMRAGVGQERICYANVAGWLNRIVEEREKIKGPAYEVEIRPKNS